jgi:hypothetical protein
LACFAGALDLAPVVSRARLAKLELHHCANLDIEGMVAAMAARGGAPLTISLHAVNGGFEGDEAAVLRAHFEPDKELPVVRCLQTGGFYRDEEEERVEDEDDDGEA